MRRQTMAQLAVTLLGMACTAAWAEAPVQNMAVKGTIKAPNCQIDIAGGQGGGAVNYGPLSTTLVKPGYAFNPLEKSTLDWTITCDSETYLTYTVADNAKDSVNTRGQAVDRVFGLGWVREGEGKLGFYTMEVTEQTVDGQAAYHGTKYSDTTLDTRTRYWGGTSYYPLYNRYVHNTEGKIHGWGASDATISAPKPGRVFTMKMDIAPQLSGSADMGDAITENVSLSGSSTFTFAFGL